MSLKTNPFYILNVSCTANRREIMSAADKLSFMMDMSDCSEAQNALLNPGKRLYAELDWLIGIDDAVILSLRKLIEQGLPLPEGDYSPLASLNVLLYNFETSVESDPDALEKAIVRMDECYSSLSVTYLIELLNSKRIEAGMVTVTEQDVIEALNVKRSAIRQIISEKLQPMHEDAYIAFITHLAEKYIGNNGYPVKQPANDDHKGASLLTFVVSGSGRHYSTPSKGKLTIGRDASNDIPIESQIVSRSHAVLYIQNSAWFLSDTNSRNGTALNGKRLIPGQDYSVSAGDVISIADGAETINVEGYNGAGNAIGAGTKIRCGDVLFDVVDRYELRIQEELEKATAEVELLINELRKCKKGDSVDGQVDQLIKSVQAWDRLAQPIQLKAMASGVTHSISQKLGQELRMLSVFLHNELDQTQAALKLSTAMKDVFAELLELSESFTKDIDTLEKLVNGGAVSAELGNAIGALKALSDAMQNGSIYVVQNKYKVLIEKMRDADRAIKAGSLPPDMQIKLRMIVFALARETAVKIHNEKHLTEYSLEITKALKDEFADVPDLLKKSTEDENALRLQLILSNKSELSPQVQIQTNTYSAPGGTVSSKVPQARTSPPRKKKTGALIAWGIILALMVIGAIIGRSSSSGRTIGSDVSATAPQEVLFSQSVPTGNPVYIDIVSIEPTYSIQTTYGKYATNGIVTEVICECKTDSGSSVWVSMSPNTYNEYFDESANFSSASPFMFYKTVTYDSPVRILGTAVRAESVYSGLSGKTDELIISFSSLTRTVETEAPKHTAVVEESEENNAFSARSVGTHSVDVSIPLSETSAIIRDDHYEVEIVLREGEVITYSTEDFVGTIYDPEQSDISGDATYYLGSYSSEDELIKSAFSLQTEHIYEDDDYSNINRSGISKAKYGDSIEASYFVVDYWFGSMHIYAVLMWCELVDDYLIIENDFHFFDDTNLEQSYDEIAANTLSRVTIRSADGETLSNSTRTSVPARNELTTVDGAIEIEPSQFTELSLGMDRDAVCELFDTRELGGSEPTDIIDNVRVNGIIGSIHLYYRDDKLESCTWFPDFNTTISPDTVSEIVNRYTALLDEPEKHLSFLDDGTTYIWNYSEGQLKLSTSFGLQLTYE